MLSLVIRTLSYAIAKSKSMMWLYDSLEHYLNARTLMNVALTNTNCDFYDTRSHRLSMRKQIFKLYVTMQLLTF